MPVLRLDRPINHQHVAVLDAVPAHAVAGHAKEERCLWVRDEDGIEVDALDEKILGRRRKAGVYRYLGHRQQQALDANWHRGGLCCNTVHAYSIGRAGAAASALCLQRPQARIGDTSHVLFRLDPR